MNNQELTKIIDQLKSNNLNKNNAYLSFLQYGGGTDESYLEANKDGLIRFALELLEASVASSSEDYISGEKEFFSLSNDWFSENSAFYFSYIEILQKSKKEIEPIEDYKETLTDKLSKYFFFGILIAVLISIIVGTITIIRWFFQLA